MRKVEAGEGRGGWHLLNVAGQCELELPTGSVPHLLQRSNSSAVASHTDIDEALTYHYVDTVDKIDCRSAVIIHQTFESAVNRHQMRELTPSTYTNTHRK